MLREEKRFVLKYNKHKSKSNRFCIVIFIKLLHVESIYSSHFFVVSHESICILNKTLFVLMLLLQIKTKNPVIFSYCWLFSPCRYTVTCSLFLLSNCKKLFIGFFKDVVQGSKGYFAMLSLQTPLLVSICSKKKVTNSTLSKFAHLLYRGT